MSKDYQRLVIIGAARSGTNMLRDALCRIDGLGTWPCDEIPFIWRYGNAGYPNDEMPAELAIPRVCRYIQRAFDRAASRYATTHLVEKTCANALRVGFVDKVVPNARYVWIIRDGRDVAASAMLRWTAPLDLPYTLRKARFAPLRDLPRHALRYARNRMHRMLSQKKRVGAWGPRFAGMDEMARQRSVAEVCAEQWARSMKRSTEDFAGMPPQKVFKVRYEDLAQDPEGQFAALLQWLGLPRQQWSVSRFVGGISTRSVGRWKTALDAESQASITPILADALAQAGYTR